MRARISFRNVPVVLLRYGSDEATLYSGFPTNCEFYLQLQRHTFRCGMQEKDRGRDEGGKRKGRWRWLN